MALVIASSICSSLAALNSFQTRAKPLAGDSQRRSNASESSQAARRAKHADAVPTQRALQMAAAAGQHLGVSTGVANGALFDIHRGCGLGGLCCAAGST